MHETFFLFPETSHRKLFQSYELKIFVYIKKIRKDDFLVHICAIYAFYNVKYMKKRGEIHVRKAVMECIIIILNHGYRK